MKCIFPPAVYGIFNSLINTFKPLLSLQSAIILNQAKMIRDCRAPVMELKPQKVKFGGEEITVNVLETRVGYFIKPVDHVYKHEFEVLFGFGAGNLGFDLERTIFIPNK